MTAARDRTTVRRGLKAGAVAGGVTMLPLVIAAAARDATLLPAAVMAGLTVAALVTAGWLFLAFILDVVAGDLPSGRRLLITSLVALGAILMPFLLLAAVTPG